MTPKEKANELYDMFFDVLSHGAEPCHDDCKKFANLTVDEIIKEFEYNSAKDHKNGYWQQVRKEITNL